MDSVLLRISFRVHSFEIGILQIQYPYSNHLACFTGDIEL